MRRGVKRESFIFLRDSEDREFPKAMPKEARAKAGEDESIVRDAKKKTIN